MSNRSYPGIRVTLGIGLVLLVICAGMRTASAQTAQFSYAITTLGGGIGSPEGVALDKSGNIYVTDDADNAVKEIPLGCASSSCVTTLGGGFYGPIGVALDKSGNIYVGDAGNGSVKEMPPGCASSSCVTTLGGGFFQPEGVAVDGSGNVYVADNGHNAVKEMPSGCASSSCVTTLGGGFTFPSGVAVDGSGNIYVADYYNNAVYQMPSGCASSSCVTTLGGGFGQPFGVAVDGSGNVYVADVGNNVKEMPPACASSSCVTTLGGGFETPEGVAVDGSGNVYVADTGNNAVKEILTHGVNFHTVPVGTTSAAIALTFTFNSAGSIEAPKVITQGVAGLDFSDAGAGNCYTANGSSFSYSAGDICTVNVTFTPTKSGPRYGGVELLNSSGAVIANAYIYGTGSGPQAIFLPGTLSTLGGGFISPQGVALDAVGNVYVADVNSGEVKEIPLGCVSSSCVTTLGGIFYYPEGVAVDGSGNIYVAVAGSSGSAVVEMPPGCASSSCVTTLGGGFSYPGGVAVDGSGNVYVADAGHSAVKQMPPGCASSSCVTTLGGGFSEPQDVAVDASGNVYVADFGNDAVKEMPPGCASSSCITTLGGSPFYYTSPMGVAVDAGGNVYTADGNSNFVTEIPPGCVSSSCVATLGSGFVAPSGVAVDGSGNVYIADSGDHLNGTVAVKELIVSNPPSLSFASTSIDTKSSDSPRTVTLKNIGNAPLSFPAPASGSNPSISENFALDSTTTCPQVSASSSPGTLAVDASCALAVDFIPTMSGTIAGSLVLTDNALNAHYATQTISLSGMGINNIPTTTTVAATSNPQEAGMVVDFVIRVVASGVGAVTNQEVTIAIDGGAPFGLTLNSAGQAVFGTASLTPGVHTVTAAFPVQAGYGPSSSTLQETISTTPASIAVASGSGQSTPYGLEFTQPLVALVIDSHGNPVSGAAVTFSGSGLRFSSTTAVTNASGRATVRAYPTAAGTLTALASVSGVGTAASFSLDATRPTFLVKANSATYTFDEPIPAPTYSFTGFVNGDTAATAVTGTAGISTPAKQGSPAGTYPLGIVQGTLSAPNYTLEFEQGTITITP